MTYNPEAARLRRVEEGKCVDCKCSKLKIECDVKCPICMGKGKLTCSDCDGSGQHECDCGHEHECQNCYGEDIECWRCSGDGKMCSCNNQEM
jgi:hypothetical protein